jgi:ABC-type uncharacterized transport system involved in gliding motility auxiliary subunit
MPAKYFKLCLYILIVVLINIVGMDVFFRADLTENKVYSLSEVSKEVVSTLSEPLTIKVFFSENLPSPHNLTERYLRDLLREYSVHGNDYFNYQFYNVSAAEQGTDQKVQQNRQLAQNYGIRPVQIQAIEQDEVQFKKAYMGVVVIHGDMVQRIQAITSTDRLEYKLTTAMQKLNNKISALLALEDKIKATFYLSPALKNVASYMGLKRLSDLPQSMQKIIKEINERNYGKLEYEFRAPEGEERINRLTEKHDLMSLEWPDLDQGKVQAGSGVIGLVLKYGQEQVDLPLLQVSQVPLLGTQYDLISDQALKEKVADSIDTLVGINQDLQYVAGKGTLNLSPSRRRRQRAQGASNFSSLASKTYNLQPVKLAEEGVPKSANCLLIPGPTEEFTDYELFQIDQALMRGTNLAVFMDAFKEISPQNQSMGMSQRPIYKPLNTGLEKLLSHYGLQIKDAFVLDKNCYQQRLGQQFGGGEQAIFYAPLIKNTNINHDLTFMKNIKGLFALKISPLKLREQGLKGTDIRVHKLFSSSKQSWEMKENINLNPMLIQPPTSEKKMGKKDLAYLLEGRFKSFFADKEVPKKEVKAPGPEEQANATQGDKAKQELSKIKGEQKVIDKGKSGKILLISSSEMLKDSLLDAEGQSPNAIFIMNAIDALNNREDIALMRSKEQRFNPLYETDATTKAVVKVFNIAGLPILVVIFGLAALLRRHRRKKHIQMMFQ